jgi:four helix bundle protein
MGVLFRRFEDMKVYKLSLEMTLEIYTLFNGNNDFDFKSQIQRASVSILNNIAEGFESDSNKAFANYIRIAKGSSGEVRSMLLLAYKLNYISRADYDLLLEKCIEISKMLNGLKKSLMS